MVRIKEMILCMVQAYASTNIIIIICLHVNQSCWIILKITLMAESVFVVHDYNVMIIGIRLAV